MIIFDFLMLKESLIDRNNFDFYNAFFDSRSIGEFQSLDVSNHQVVAKTVLEELRFSVFEIVPEDGQIRYASIIFGYRDTKKYVFSLNALNSFNQTIQAKMPFLNMSSLNLPNGVVYNFYFILNKNDLSSFAKLFSDWLMLVDQPLVD